jgi:hypothetical protein
MFKRLVILVFALVGCVAPATNQFAAEALPVASEIREFEVFVDDAKAGKSTVTISEYEDGRVVTTASADIRVTILLFNYVYQFNGTEEWLENRPRALQSRTVDGFKQLSLKAQFEPDRTTLQAADGRPRTAGAHVMTTNFWRLPPSEMLDKRIPVLDADTGKTLQLQFQYQGTKPLTLIGKPFTSHYFKVTGDKPCELWFDGGGRLVRHLGVEDGHKTEFRLSAFRPAGKDKR